jgi:hypothetical protein
MVETRRCSALRARRFAKDSAAQIPFERAVPYAALNPRLPVDAGSVLPRVCEHL